MTTLLAHGRLRDIERMHLHFGLGKAHDDLNEFEAASSFRRREPYPGRDRRLSNRDPLLSSVESYIRLFPRGENRFDPALGVDDQRPVFILGLPSSGTTLVEQILSSHPAVAAGGELGFWGS